MEKKELFISGVLLAAGEAKRWSGELPKQLTPLDGEPIVRIIAKRALRSRLAELVVIIGHMANSIRSALSDLDLEIVNNPEYREGLSSSVKVALGSISPSADAAIFMPADQPFLSTALLEGLIQTYEKTGAPIVVPSYQGRSGAPRLFDCSLFSELARISGDEGGRQILEQRRADIAPFPLDSERALMDIDTVEDYQKLVDPS